MRRWRGLETFGASPGIQHRHRHTERVERREFLVALAAGTAAVLSGCSQSLRAASAPARTSAPHANPNPLALPVPRSTPSQVNPHALSGVMRVGGSTPQLAGADAPATIDTLPATQNGLRPLAFTIDDGVSTAVLDAYVDFIIASGIRATFFVNGVYDSWTFVRPKLAPLVESGQVQLGNHTWSHPSITGLTARQITDELVRNEQFLLNTYGVSGQPYFRPPYGNHDERTDAVTNGLGYPRTVMWYGSLGDSALLSPAQIFANAKEWLLPGRVVIGHANHPPVTYIYAQLVALIRQRHLQTVTLNDVFAAPA